MTFHDFVLVLVPGFGYLGDRLNLKRNFIAGDDKQLLVKRIEGIFGAIVTHKQVVVKQFAVHLAGGGQGDRFGGTGISDFHSSTIAGFDGFVKGANRTVRFG